MKIKLPGKIWKFKDDARGNEAGEFGEYKEDNDVYIDGLHYSNMKNVFTRRQRSKWDNWIIYAGDEGDGKSLIAKQDCYIMAHLCGGKFDVTQTAWQANKFAKLIDDSSAGDSVLYDEAITGLDTQRTMSEVNHILRIKSTTCRKKRLFVAICIPSLFDLQKSIAVRRSFGMVKVYTNEVKRGYFTYYNRSSKRKLYIQGKRFEDMDAWRGGPPSRFLRWSFVDEVEYEKMKDSEHTEIYKETAQFNKYKDQRNAFINMLYHKYNIKQINIAKDMKEFTNHNLSHDSIQVITSEYKNKYQENQENVDFSRATKNEL